MKPGVFWSNILLSRGIEGKQINFSHCRQSPEWYLKLLSPAFDADNDLKTIFCFSYDYYYFCFIIIIYYLYYTRVLVLTYILELIV